MLAQSLMKGKPFAGNGYISGGGKWVVTVAGGRSSRRVVLIDKKTGRPVDGLVSNADGSYRFGSVAARRKYIVVGFDHQLQFQAVIRDNITPAEET